MSKLPLQELAIGGVSNKAQLELTSDPRLKVLEEDSSYENSFTHVSATQLPLTAERATLLAQVDIKKKLSKSKNKMTSKRHGMVTRKGRDGDLRTEGLIPEEEEANRRWNLEKELAKVRRELGKKFRGMSLHEKFQYTTCKEPVMEEVDTQPPAMMSSESRKEVIESRCRTESFSAICAELSVEQKDVVKALGFGSLLSMNCGRLRRYIYSFVVDKFDIDTLSVELYKKTFKLSTNVYSQIMGLENRGQLINLDGDSKQIEELIEIYKGTSRGIKVNVLIEKMKILRSADDEFKITFMLFVIGTILCPQGGIYVSSSYLHVLKDVTVIHTMNWASWCFKLLIDEIKQFKSLGHRGVTGCVLFLQIFYLHHVKWNTLLVDRSKIPVTVWTNDIIKKFTKWLKKQGGLESIKIDGVDNSKFNVGNEVEIHHAMKIMMNNVQNILHIVTNMDGRLKLVEASLNEIMKTNGENAANMAANNSRVDDGGLIVEEVNHNFVDVSFKDNKSISKSNKKMKSFSPIMTTSSQNDDEQLMRNMVNDSRNIPILVDESDHDDPNDMLLDRHYNIRRNLMQIRKANERKPSRYQLSPYDKCCGRTKNKFQAGPFEVSTPVSESDLKLIQFIFDPNLNQRFG
ncbi:hypothetical protein Q3G72_013330 [Acer saccharum]|nr:hypothetical protein Q3G72_013330 [Acer saccharum]